MLPLRTAAPAYGAENYQDQKQGRGLRMTITVATTAVFCGGED
ncbi:hypothetical protein [Granulicella mallensis]|nr:hypothetical protein [Granulicella mallensis]